MINDRVIINNHFLVNVEKFIRNLQSHRFDSFEIKNVIEALAKSEQAVNKEHINMISLEWCRKFWKKWGKV